MEDHCFLAHSGLCLASCPMQISTTYLGNSGLVPPTLLNSQDTPSQTCLETDLVKTISQL